MSKTKKGDGDQCLEVDSPEGQQAIARLREMVKEEKNLRIRTDDVFLLRYLHTTGFDSKRAFKKIQTFYQLKVDHPAWFSHSPIETHKPLLERHIHVTLPDRDNKGRRIYVVKLGNIDPTTASPQTLSHLDDLWLEACADEAETQKNGVAIILDMAGYSWHLLRWLTPSNLRVGTRKAENIAVKIEHHLVNTTTLLNAAVAIVFPFLSQTMKETIHFHYQNWPSLHKHINPEILPREYGGHKPAIDYATQQKTLLYDQEDRILDALKMGYEVDT